MALPVRISYWFVAGTFLLVGVFHLGTPLLAALFSFLLLERLTIGGRKRLAIVFFVLLLLGLSILVGRFAAQAVVALPDVANKAIPSITDWADRQGVELPFTDWASLREVMLQSAKGQAQSIGRFATGATREAVFLIIGIVVACSVFWNPAVDLDRGRHRVRNNLYSTTAEAIAERFRLLYASFVTVMGAQIVISAINTALTAVFALAVGLPNVAVILGVTFLCGLFPVIGNLISNTIITAIAFTVSPQTALFALGFLVLIHKLEYFLNSKIVGDRIRNPVWLTLVGLILGERLMGIPGMIFAPVLLHYVKVEASSIEADAEEVDAPPVAAAELPGGEARRVEEEPVSAARR